MDPVLTEFRLTESLAPIGVLVDPPQECRSLLSVEIRTITEGILKAFADIDTRSQKTLSQLLEQIHNRSPPLLPIILSNFIIPR